MATISRRNSGQGCPGHISTPTHHYLAIFAAPSPWQPGVTVRNQSTHRETEGDIFHDLLGAVTNTNSYLNVKQPQLLITLEYE